MFYRLVSESKSDTSIEYVTDTFTTERDGTASKDTGPVYFHSRKIGVDHLGEKGPKTKRFSDRFIDSSLLCTSGFVSRVHPEDPTRVKSLQLKSKYSERKLSVPQVSVFKFGVTFFYY